MSANWRISSRSQWLKSKLPPVVEDAIPCTASVVVGVGWMKVVGVPLLALLPSPHRPSSRDSKNPKTEKSPCVMVARAAVDHNVATVATAATSRQRHLATIPVPQVPAVMKLLLHPTPVFA